MKKILYILISCLIFIEIKPMRPENHNDKLNKYFQLKEIINPNLEELNFIANFLIFYKVSINYLKTIIQYFKLTKNNNLENKNPDWAKSIIFKAKYINRKELPKLFKLCLEKEKENINCYIEKRVLFYVILDDFVDFWNLHIASKNENRLNLREDLIENLFPELTKNIEGIEKIISIFLEQINNPLNCIKGMGLEDYFKDKLEKLNDSCQPKNELLSLMKTNIAENKEIIKQIDLINSEKIKLFQENYENILNIVEDYELKQKEYSQIYNSIISISNLNCKSKQKIDYIKKLKTPWALAPIYGWEKGLEHDSKFQAFFSTFCPFNTDIFFTEKQNSFESKEGQIDNSFLPDYITNKKNKEKKTKESKLKGKKNKNPKKQDTLNQHNLENLIRQTVERKQQKDIESKTSISKKAKKRFDKKQKQLAKEEQAKIENEKLEAKKDFYENYGQYACKYHKRIKDFIKKDYSQEELELDEINIEDENKSIFYHTYSFILDIFIKKYGERRINKNKQIEYFINGFITYRKMKKQLVEFSIVFTNDEKYCYHRGYKKIGFLDLTNEQLEDKDQYNEITLKYLDCDIYKDNQFKENKYFIKIYDKINDAYLTIIKP